MNHRDRLLILSVVSNSSECFWNSLVLIGYHLQGIEVFFHHTHQVVGVGGYSHGLVESLQRPFHFLTVRLLANEDTNSGVLPLSPPRMTGDRYVLRDV